MITTFGINFRGHCKRFAVIYSFYNSAIHRKSFGVVCRAKKQSTTILPQILLQMARCEAILFSQKRLSSNDNNSTLDLNEYTTVSEETLESLSEKFEEILEIQTKLEDTDVSLSSGVLTINLGKEGIYVINKQTPNRQIWLSSPKSGPKRYDFINGCWIYKHDNVLLHDLLSKELSKIFETKIDFSDCSYGN